MGAGNTLIKSYWVNGLLSWRTNANSEIIRFNTSGIYIPSTGTLEVDGTLQFDAALGMNSDIQFTTTGKGLKTGTTSGNTYLLTAYDVDGAAHTTFFTFACASSPSCTLNQDLGIANGKAIKTSTTTTQTVLFQAYDVDAGSFQTLITLTAASSPSVTFTIADGINFSGNTGTYVFDFASSGTVISASDTDAASYNTAEGYIAVDVDTTVHYIYLHTKKPSG